MSLGNAASPKLITHGSTLKALISPAVAFTRLDLQNPASLNCTGAQTFFSALY